MNNEVAGPEKTVMEVTAAPGQENRALRRWRSFSRWIDRTALVLLLMTAVLTGLALADDLRLSAAANAVEYQGFRELLATNPDTVGWLRVEGAGVDHPVVQGQDNFEYLDRAFTGEFYEGGTLFLDAANEADFSDEYSIIHGHHMAGGAMFGYLEKYLDPDYAGQHSEGRLLTPSHEYDLLFAGACVCNAYDSGVFAPGSSVPEKAAAICGVSTGNQRILALSTCTSDLSDDRTVVFWRMTGKREHEEGAFDGSQK